MIFFVFGSGCGECDGVKHQSVCVDLAQQTFEDQAAHQEDFVSLLRA